MEQWTVYGFKKINFKDKTGKQISGFNLFLVREPLPDSGITGSEVMKLFISSDYVTYTPKVADVVNLIYNRYGKVGSIQVV